MTKLPLRRKARLIRVPADEAGRRLDNFLLAQLKGVPRPRIYRMIRGGEVRINGGRCRPDRRLLAGDEVRVPPVHDSGPLPGSRSSGPPEERVQWLTDQIVFEDQDLLVLNKPAGLAVHGGSGISWGVIELLRAARPGERGLELVHRLDRETSGCLLIAKRRPTLRELHAQFRDGQVRKHYLALLCGRMKGEERFIDEPLLTTERRGGERHVRVDPMGKPARSRITPQRRYRAMTLADVLIETGRTHQIRVHAASIGHPVAGDERYGRGLDDLCRRYRLTRLFLHADRLTFDHPRTGHVVNVVSPLDAELEQVRNKLSAEMDD